MIKSFLLIFFCLQIQICSGQSGQWQLWASGLPQGAYPRMVVAPNHDIFFALLGTPFKLGTIFKANTLNQQAGFVELPPVPRPLTVQNNIVALGYNAQSEPLAGIYRTDINEPWLFHFNSATQKWDTSRSDLQPTLGAQSIATDSKGNIYVGTRWAYIYKSTDHGKTFKAIDEAKILAEKYPCYYPTFINNSSNNGSLFSINIDRRDRIYAGTETAGVIFSDDQGESWHPADLFACLTNKNILDTNSRMLPLTRSGNVAAVGFTKDHNVVWSGNDMWYFNWRNEIGFANMQDSTTTEIKGLPDYLVQRGQQVSKIVTTQNGTMFFHSGSSNGATQIGIYKSNDGIHWQYFNDGISGQNDGLSQGSLAVDGDKVFMSTHDGNVWMYDASLTSAKDIKNELYDIEIYPNPFREEIQIQNITNPLSGKLYNLFGELMMNFSVYPGQSIKTIDIPEGFYYLELKNEHGQCINKKLYRN